MANVSSNLTPRLRRLERVLAAGAAGREHEWAERVGEGLEALFASLRRHAAEAETRDGPMTEVDLNRPTLARQVAGLQREHAVLLDRVMDLCQKVHSARRAFEPQAVSPRRSSPTIPDFGDLRQRASDLVACLRRHESRETDLVLESVTTDLGVGD